MAFVSQTYSVGEILAASKMNQIDTNIDLVRTSHKGSSAPASLEAGILWIDDTTTPWTWKVYDGADWIDIATINPTDNEFLITKRKLLHIQDQKTAAVDGGTFTSGARRTRDLNTEITNEISGSGLMYDLPYDAETTGFTTIGQTITGGTSGATGTLVKVTDAGSTGNLYLINVTGTFQDNEVITGATEGSATSNIPSPDDTNKGLDYANQFYLESGTYFIDGEAPSYQVNTNMAFLYNISDSVDIIEGTTQYSSATSGVVGESNIRGRFTLASAKIFEIQHQCETTKTTHGFGTSTTNYGSHETYTDLLIWKVA